MKSRFLHFVVFLAAILLAFSIVSCGRRLPDRLEMEENPVLTGGIGWIVVSEAYVRVKSEPGPEAPEIGHLRGGDLLRVTGRDRIPETGVVWYEISMDGRNGWLKESQAVFFENRDPAERAAVQYK